MKGDFIVKLYKVAPGKLVEFIEGKENISVENMAAFADALVTLVYIRATMQINLSLWNLVIGREM